VWATAWDADLPDDDPDYPGYDLFTGITAGIKVTDQIDVVCRPCHKFNTNGNVYILYRSSIVYNSLISHPSLHSVAAGRVYQ
jgi:hypothetical protein